MAQLSLAQMRAKLQEQETSKTKYEKGGDKASYAFWDIPDNSTATVRFLPDGNSENGWFWVERMIIKMPFPGTKGGDTNKQVMITVPCMEMYSKSCPVMEEIKSLGWWKGTPEEQALARTYYKKRSYLYQGFVVTSPIKEENLPENTIRRFVINKSIHDKIKASLMDADIEYSPIDYENGLDFKIIKTKKGQYANYDTSTFSRKTRTLSEDELQAIETHGLFDLRTFLPKEPDEKTQKLIMEMFEASINNELFDGEKFKAFKPFSSNTTAATTDDVETDVETTVETITPKTTVTVKKAETVVQETVEPTVNKLKSTGAEENTTSAPKKSPQDVLALLRAKKAEKENQN